MPKTPYWKGRAARCLSRSCQLTVLARAMDVNALVTNPNVHGNKIRSLLARRWRKWEERKLEVSALDALCDRP